VKDVPDQLFGVGRREIDARFGTHDDHMDLARQGVGDRSRLDFAQEIEVACVADSIPPNSIHRVIDECLPNYGVSKAGTLR
jgi:hypothetical protein